MSRHSDTNKANKMTQNANIEFKSYKQAETEYLLHMKKLEVSNQELKNVRTSLSAWRKMNGIKEIDPIGEELGSAFEKKIHTFAERQELSDIKHSTYSSRMSKIRKFKDFCQNQGTSVQSQEDFALRLTNSVRRSGITRHKFYQTHLVDKISLETFLAWCKGTHIPYKKNLPIIEEIELILCLGKGYLISLLEDHYKNKETSNFFRDIPYRLRLRENIKKPYRYWGAIQEQELKSLTLYKTSIVPPNGLLRAKNSSWTGSEEEFPSENNLRRYLKALYGFVMLPEDNSDPQLRGLGMSEKLLSIALLTDKNILNEFITVFRKSRSGNKFNNGSLTFINIVICLLREKVGYIYQKPELAKKINLSVTEEEWRQRCLDTRHHLIALKDYIVQAEKNGSAEFQIGRDPRSPIKHILNLDNPLSATMEATLKMIKDIKKLNCQPKKQAVLYRDMLLIAFLQANPLRASMFGKMKLHHNLYKKNDGSWWLRFKREDFKNRKFLREDYLVRVSPALWGMIDEYINKYRPLLLENRKGDFIFFNPRKEKHKVKIEKGMSPNYLYSIIFRVTKKYVSGSPGFGPHAFRYIVATSIVKADPAGGFNLAASVLHDTLDTVKRAYAYLSSKDKFEPYNDFFSDNWENCSLKNSSNK